MKHFRRIRVDDGFTLVELLVVIAIIGVLVALLLPAVQSAREAARLATCKNNLKQHGIALHLYHDTYGQFPVGVSGGITAAESRDFQDGYGWAVALLPYLEQQPLYDLIQPDFKPGPFRKAYSNNHQIIPGGDTQLAVFRCPSSQLGPHAYPKYSDSPAYATSDYKGCTGNRDAGVFYKAKDGHRYGFSQVRFADVTDGTSNTIAFGESAYYRADGGISNRDNRNWPIWMGAPGGGSDEATLFKTDRWAPINCAVINKGNYLSEAIDDDCSFSWHSGGALFTFADGSVHWLSDDIHAETYWNLGTKNDGEVILDYE